MAKVLAIGDLHEPACHPGYRRFCLDLQKKYKTTKTVFLGDVIDHQAISFHAANPMCPGPIDEYLLIKQRIRPWYQAFPKAFVTIGNHDRRVLRLAESVNIPAKYLRDYDEVWKTPSWKWVDSTIIDDVYYFHGEGRSGKNPAFNAMIDEGMSAVMGHCHTASGVKWRTAPVHRQFGLDVGCGIDVKAFQFAYGKHMRQRPVLSAAVVIDGTPDHRIMPCGPGEKYHKSKFRR
jgi:predicted phosphodiesterase